LWIALDANTGDTIWTYKIPPNEWAAPNAGSYGGPPVIANGKMYIHVYNGIATLDPNTGLEIDRWNIVARSFYDAYSQGDLFTVILNETDGKFYAARGDPQTKTLKWTSKDRSVGPLGYSDVGFGTFSGVALSDAVYVNEYNFTGGATGPSRIFKIGTQDGVINWAFTAQGYAPNIAVAYNNLYFGTSAGNVYALSKIEGTSPVWQFKAGPVYAPVVLADQKVFFGSEDSYIYSIDAFTGNLIWKYKTGGAIVGSPVIAENKLFIASQDHYLYVFGASQPKPKSILTIANPVTINLGQSVAISGKLTDEAGKGVANSNITLQDRLIPRIEWSNITSISTDSTGNFQYTWTPTIEAYFDLGAVYDGDNLSPAQATSLLKVSGPPQTIDITPLAPYLSIIVILEIITIATVVILYSKIKK